MLDVHRELAALIEMRDAAGARRLMDDHVKMIRARRVAEQRPSPITAAEQQNRGRTPWTSCEPEIHHPAALPAAGMGRRGEGLLHGRRARLRIPGDRAVDRRQGARPGRQGRRDADLREGPHLRHQLRLPLDRQRRGREGPRQALRRRLFGVAGAASSCRRIRRSRRRRISPACRSRSATSRAATTRPSRRSSNTCRPTRSTCRSTTACCSAAWSC